MKVLFYNSAFTKLKKTAEFASKYLRRSFALNTGKNYEWTYEVTGYLLGEKKGKDYIVKSVITPEAFNIRVPHYTADEINGFMRELERDQVMQGFLLNLTADYTALFMCKELIPKIIYIPKFGKEAIIDEIGNFHNHKADVTYSDWGKTGDKASLLNNNKSISAVISYYSGDFNIACYKAVKNKIVHLEHEVINIKDEVSLSGIESIENAIKDFDVEISRVETAFNAVPWMGCGPRVVSN